MKNHIRIVFAMLALSTFSHQLSILHAQGTAFTYQGQLQNSNGPVQGTYNFTFTLFATNVNGTAVAGPVTNNGVVIANGLFIATIDFGAAAWNGETNWLQIAVETNGASAFTNLSPRQEVTPAPYAITAETIPASQLTSIGNTNGGIGNFFVGPSGNTTNSGSDNTAMGLHALNNNASGSRNTAVGEDALNDNTSGSDNTAYGVSALFSNTSGSENTANGYQALFSNTSGSLNIALGYQAGNQITTGGSNLDIGNNGLSTDTNIIRIGSGQTQAFIAGVINGDGGGLTDLSAAQLTSIGNTNGGINNFFIGQGTGNSATTGSFNTATGNGAFQSDTSGLANTADGDHALLLNTSGNDNTAIGSAALNNNVGGSFNTAVGVGTLYFNTNGNNNTATGFQALFSNTNGSENTAMGSFALFNNVSGNDNTAVGGNALDNNTNSDNTAVGYQALFADIGGEYNTGVGFQALLSNTNGNYNTALGYNALAFSTNSSENTAIGVATLPDDTTGSQNTGVGVNALFDNASGSENTAIGFQALFNNTSGSTNIALGYLAGYNITTGSSNIDIGNEGFSTDNNIIRIGSVQATTFLVGDVGLNETNPAGALHITGPTNAPPSSEPAGDNGLVLGTTGPSGYKWIQTFGGPLVLNPTSNNVGIDNSSPSHLLVVGPGGAYCDGTTWAMGSDRNSKENFSAINLQEVLDKVSALPITEWQYKTARGLKHIGPMAQDFYAAFGLNGGDDKHITTVDEGGVALAAIQGLNQKLEEQAKEKDAEIADLKKQNDSLAERLSDLEQTVKTLAQRN